MPRKSKARNQRTEMIIKVQFRNKMGQTENILFGDSYKPWKMQYREYLRLAVSKDFGIEPVRVWKSKSAWIGWGGLKWVDEEYFQEELNREGVQEGEADNPNPRKYSEMSFEEISLTKLNQWKNK